MICYQYVRLRCCIQRCYPATIDGWIVIHHAAYSRGFATKDKTSEEMQVESKVRDELGEPEGPGVRDKAKQAVSKVGEKVKDAGKAMKGSIGNQKVDIVGDTVKVAGDTIKDKAAKKQTLGKEDVVTS